MESHDGNRAWFWTTLLLSCLTIISVVFAAWELVEQQFFRNLDFRQLHYLYITRGVASSLLLAVWAVWFVLRERRKTEDELRRSRERYWAMLAHAADAVVLLDRHLKVLEWNPQASALYGYERDEVIGKPLLTLGLAEQEEMVQILDRLERGEPGVEIETRRRNREGEWVDVALQVSSFQEVGTGERVVLEMASDLREKIRLRRKALEIEKLTSMGRMAAGTAHTLNTPLAAMLLRIDMVKEQLRGHHSEEEIRHLESSTRFCQEFVQKLLQYSRPSETSLQRVNVGDLLASIQTFFEPTFRVRRHALSYANQNLNGVFVHADRSQMEALFGVLLMNSLDALPVSGGGCVKLEGSARDSRVELVVSDTGSGIPAEHLARVFEPFFTTKQAGQGTGLGLSIARNIVHDHAGNIELTNNPSGGVTVRISLPTCGNEPASSPSEPDLAFGAGGRNELRSPNSDR